MIAEKPDAVRKIAVAVGWNGKRGGSEMHLEDTEFDNKRYTIFSGIGHHFEVCDPQIYSRFFHTLGIA